MSLTEENDVQVIVMESPSPASSAISSSSSTTDSDSASEHEPAALENIEEEEDQEARTPLEVDEEEDVENEESNVVIFRRDLPGLSRSTSPLEIKEGRCSGDEYPLSQRVYSSPTCGISTGLQRQCCDLWGQFDTIGTEMIVTRRGRRMFPPLKIELFDLNPNSTYILLMDMAPVDKYRYKYQNSSWVRCFEEECSPTRLYVHPDSPSSGSHWMNTVINFYKMKLTNNQLDRQGHIIVNSMHKYQPRLHVVESEDINNLDWDNFKTFLFPGTQFTTVTAYQNDKITQLKIENNPFAKGFRSPFSRCRTRNQPRAYSLQSTGSSDSDEILRSPMQATYYMADHRKLAALQDQQFVTLVGQKRKSEGGESESGVKQICLTPPAGHGLVEVPKRKVYPISVPCAGGTPPTLTPVSAMSEITSHQLPPSQQPQAPIFIIYTGQQQPKSSAAQVNSKLLQNSQFSNEAAFLQAQHAGQAFQVIQSGNGLPAPAQILFPAPQTNGIIQQQKRELPNGHFPAVINGQTIIQTPPPTFVNINGTTALLQQNGHPTAFFPPRSLASEVVSITVPTSPPHLLPKKHTFPPPHLLPKKHTFPKHAVPISINHGMVSEIKKCPPPLVQVKEEDMTESGIIVPMGTSGHVTPFSVSTRTSPTQISPKMAVLPFSLFPDSLRAPTTVLKAPPPTHPSLPYILLNEKQAGASPRQLINFVKPTSAPSSSTVPPVYNGSNMPIYRFSTLNNIQPLQILTTSVPSHGSCIALPDFMKQDTTIAH